MEVGVRLWVGVPVWVGVSVDVRVLVKVRVEVGVRLLVAVELLVGVLVWARVKAGIAKKNIPDTSNHKRRRSGLMRMKDFPFNSWSF